MHEIVVGVDDSSASEKALDRALSEAATRDLPVQVVHAWTTPVWMGGIAGMGYNVLASPIDSGQAATELAAELLSKGMSRRTSDAQITVETAAPEGDPGRTLVRLSAEADLVVVGGRSQGYIKSALLGSVTSYVLHHASCPVMIVPESAGQPEDLQRVVVGVDFSPSSRTALLWGLQAAQRAGCPLVAVHAWLVTTLPGRPPLQFVPELPEYANDVRAALDKELHDTLPAGHGVDVHAELSHTSAAAGLLVESTPNDLLVLGSRGRGGFASLVLGSVATQCAQHASGPVVVVRSPAPPAD